MGTGASNSHCTDAMNLPISDWLFHLEGGTIPSYCALQFLPCISIRVNRLCISIVFGSTDWLSWWLTSSSEVQLTDSIIHFMSSNHCFNDKIQQLKLLIHWTHYSLTGSWVKLYQWSVINLLTVVQLTDWMIRVQLIASMIQFTSLTSSLFNSLNQWPKS